MIHDDQILSTKPGVASEMWSIDADASLQSVLDRPDSPPLLRQTLVSVLSWQARNETPVRRALTAPRVALQWVAALMALGARVSLEGEAGPMDMPLETLLQRKAKGRALSLNVPPGDPCRRWGEAHVARTPADEPIVAAIAVVEMDGPSTSSGQGGVVHQIRVALIGVWSEPVRLAEAPARLMGGPIDEDRIQVVAAAVEEEVAPRGDFLGSKEYRRAMAGVLTRRALERCLRQEVASYA